MREKRREGLERGLRDKREKERERELTDGGTEGVGSTLRRVLQTERTSSTLPPHVPRAFAASAFSNSTMSSSFTVGLEYDFTAIG